MNTKTLLLSVALACTLSVSAQTSDGGLSSDMLAAIRKAQPTAASDKALANAIAANSIDDLAKTYASTRQVDTYFSNETPRQSIHNQKSSGRCWMFSGLNVLRANFAKLHADTLRVEYSQAYLFFYD